MQQIQRIMLEVNNIFPNTKRINQAKFFMKFQEHNTKNVLLMSYLALLFFLVCISMDAIRYFDGGYFDQSIYQILLILHFCLLLFLIPIFYLKAKAKKKIRKKIPLWVVMLWFFGSLAVLIGIAIVAMIARNNLITFAVIILAYNGLYLLPIKKRMIFNGIILLIMISFSGINAADLFDKVANIIEIAGLCLLAIVFGNNMFIAFVNQVTLDDIREKETQGLKEMERTKNRYFANISHEFRTPLSVIKGLANEIEEPRVKEIIKRNANKTLNLIDQILNLAKLENQEMTLKMHLDDIVPYIRFLLESIKPLAEAKNINIKLITKIDKLEMDYSPFAIQVMFNNLLSNAIKFSPATSTIEVLISEKDGKLLLGVKDQGPGLGEEEKTKIFDRFYSAENQTVSSSGIGLSLIKELLDQLEGSISVESVPGLGSLFQIKVPIHRKAIKEELPLEDSLALDENTNQKISLLDDSFILIVEDNQDLRDHYESQLSKDYPIRLCTNGREAMDIIKKEIPRLIISDILMPEMTGLELSSQLLSDEQTDNIPLIFISSKIESELQPESMRERNRDFLQKPFKMDEMKDKIETLLLQAASPKLDNKPQSQFPEENQFLKDVFAAIEENMHQEDFGIVQLCFNLNISRTQLYRKLKEQSGKSASELIREKRIEKASSLIILTDKTVNEICYELGFKDPSYFSKIFKQVTGELPSTFKKRHKKT